MRNLTETTPQSTEFSREQWDEPIKPLIHKPKQKFFQYPLGVLAYGDTAPSKAVAIVAYGTMYAGICKEEILGGKDDALNWLGKYEITSQFNPEDDDDHRAWALGKAIVGFSWQDNPIYCVYEYNKVSMFLDEFGATPFVRMPADIVQEFYGGSFEPRDFYVLSAVYAVIGSKQFAIVRRDRVRAGALGYPGAKILFDENGRLTTGGGMILDERADKALPLSVDQVRRVLNRLHARKFFSRINPKGPNGGNCHKTYYSRGMNHDVLGTMLATRIAKQREAHAAQMAAEATLPKKTGAARINKQPPHNPPRGRPVTRPEAARIN